jgi:hypothetical protein
MQKKEHQLLRLSSKKSLSRIVVDLISSSKHLDSSVSLSDGLGMLTQPAII